MFWKLLRNPFMHLFYFTLMIFIVATIYAEYIVNRGVVWWIELPLTILVYLMIGYYTYRIIFILLKLLKI